MGAAIVVLASAVTLVASDMNQGKVMIVGDMNIAHERKVIVGIRTGEMIQIT